MEPPAPISGSILLFCGVLVVIIGLVILLVITVKLLFTVLGSTWGGEPTGGSGPSDWAKLVEAIAKLPIWALALLAGDVQIWLGLRLLGTNIFK